MPPELLWKENVMETKTRWCSRRDTISTVTPMTFGSFAGNKLRVVPVTAEACATANDLIAAGRWEVTDCGKCNLMIADCKCE